MDRSETMNEAAMEEKRKRMFERLNARHSQASASSNSPLQTTAAFEPKELDSIQVQAKALLDDPNASIDPSLLEQIESALSLLAPGFESRRLRDLHGKLRAQLQQQRNQTSSFSFSSKKPAVAPVTAPSVETANVPSKGVKSSIARSKESRTVSDMVNEVFEVQGSDGEDVAIMNISDSKGAIKFNASTVHLKQVNSSVLVLAPVQSSILIRDCSGLTLVAAAQQIRIHNSRDLRLHIAVRGAVIVEDCDQVQVAPYRVGGISLEWDNDNWKEVKDFNWLAGEKQSPHWSIMGEDNWEQFDLGFV